MPRMKAISTIANDCSEDPKISASEREASTSSPIETPPVNATIQPAHVKDLKVTGASGSTATGDLCAICGAGDVVNQPLWFKAMAQAPMRMLAAAVDCSVPIMPKRCTRKNPARV